LALLLILAGDIPKSLPTVLVAALGTLLKFVNFVASILASATSVVTSSVIFNFSATTCPLVFLPVSTVSVVTSSAATPLASVTSSVNCSPSTLRDASIALAGKNLFT